MTRIRIAAFSPGPPQRSGGAVYAGILLPRLAERSAVTWFSPERVDWAGTWARPEEYLPSDFDVAVHFLGNNPEHLAPYASSLRWPGIVVLHDLVLSHVLWTHAPMAVRRELSTQLGPAGAERVMRRWLRRHPSRSELYLGPFLRGVTRNAEMVIVHSRFAALAVHAQSPHVPIRHIPMPVVPPSRAPLVSGGLDRAVRPSPARTRTPHPFTIGLFGHLADHKRIPQALSAVARAREGLRCRHVAVRLVIVGPSPAAWVEREVERLGLGDDTVVTGLVDDQTFEDWMASTDVVLNLRFPSAGESSFVSAQATALGIPVLTSDYAQFSEERGAIRVPIGHAEVDAISRALVQLATCGVCREGVRVALGENAAIGDMDRVVESYLAACEAVVGDRLHRGAPIRNLGPIDASVATARLSTCRIGELDEIVITGSAPDPGALLALANRALSPGGVFEWRGAGATFPGLPRLLDRAGFAAERARGSGLVVKAGIPEADLLPRSLAAQ